MRKHFWQENQPEITPLGWFHGTNPELYPTDEWTKEVQARLLKVIKSKKDTPNFKIVFCSPSIEANNRKNSTKAHRIQTETKDARRMDKLLQKAFKDNLIYIKYRLCYNDPTSYLKLIFAHSQEISWHRAIPIYGITTDMMFYLKEKIEDSANIQSVFPTRKTNT